MNPVRWFFSPENQPLRVLLCIIIMVLGIFALAIAIENHFGLNQLKLEEWRV